MKTGIFFDGHHCVKHFKSSGRNKEKFLDVDFSKVLQKILKELDGKTEGKLNVLHKIWFQGISTDHIGDVKIQETEDLDVLRKIIWKYHNERKLEISLIKNGVETVFLEHAEDVDGNKREKGIDTALVVNCLNSVSQFNLECVILCTNDSDFEPLLHNLRKKGVYTIVVFFCKKSHSVRLTRQSDTHIVY